VSKSVELKLALRRYIRVIQHYSVDIRDQILYPKIFGYFCYRKEILNDALFNNLFQLDLNKLCKNDCVNNGLRRMQMCSIILPHNLCERTEDSHRI
jgi:hypothetical protein